MLVSAACQIIVPGPTVCKYGRSFGHNVTNKWLETCNRGIRNMTHTDSPKALRLLNLDSYHNDRLAGTPTTFPSLLDTTYKGFINLDLKCMPVNIGHARQHTTGGANRLPPWEKRLLNHQNGIRRCRSAPPRTGCSDEHFGGPFSQPVLGGATFGRKPLTFWENGQKITTGNISI